MGDDGRVRFGASVSGVVMLCRGEDVVVVSSEQSVGGCGGACACGSGGCGEGGRVPELDARPIDAAIRQAAILGVVMGLALGSKVAVVTDERPELILMLIEQQVPGQYEIESVDSDGQCRTVFARIV